jgi:hypothetical protein
MRALTLLAGLAMAGAAAAQPVNIKPPTMTTQCVDVGGQVIPPVCDAPASRLETREYICTCINGGMLVKVPVCAKGQYPPPEGKQLNIVRRDASKDGSLLGDDFDGRQICVAPRGALTSAAPGY